MNAQAEISPYPLRTNDPSDAIQSFLGERRAADLLVRQGSMSSMVAGNVDAVFKTVGAAFKTVAEDGQVVLMMKVSNACPSGGASEGI